MNKCPRCKNEKTREDYDYCPICGVNLNEEMKKAGVDVLKFLMNSYIEKECNDSEEEEFKKLIVGALEVAILELERTAQEVPVQEQSVITIDMNESFVTSVNEKLTSIILELNELLEQTTKVVTSQSF